MSGREPSVDEAPQRPGSFETHAFSNDAGTRAHKVYVPAAAADSPRAMVLMLHGCIQSADDFAARNADESPRAGARLPGGVFRAGRTREPVEVPELVLAAGPTARRWRTFTDRRHRSRGGTKTRHRQAPHLCRRGCRRALPRPWCWAKPTRSCLPVSGHIPACLTAVHTTSVGHGGHERETQRPAGAEDHPL